MNNKSIFSRIGTSLKAHKAETTIIVLVCLIGGYEIYHSSSAANATTQYVVSPAHMGTLTQTVTGTGQVSASNQTDIQSQVSGTIESINVKVGDAVTSGQLLATMDSSNAAISLKNAQVSLAKLREPAKATDISNATQNISKSYGDLYNAVSTVYLDLPSIMTGLNDMFYKPNGFLSDQALTYLTPDARTYRLTADKGFDSSYTAYQNILLEYKNTSQDSSTSTIARLASDTEDLIKGISKVASDAQNAITFITTSQPDYEKTTATAAANNINTWSNQINTDLANLVSAENTLQSNENTLTNLVIGADQYDLQAAELNLEQAQKTYDSYFIRAPYDGIIGRIPVNVFGQAGNGTVVATIVGAQKLATVSLDEVDAAKVQTGQPVSITFDAIDNFTATGTVQVVDQVGTVSQGVVSYGVKILINTADPRIKPGMSVNTTIITTVLNNVLLIPTAAIKASGNMSYVNVLNVSTTTIRALLSANRPATSSTTNAYARSGQNPNSNGTSTNPGYIASSTDQGDFGSTTVRMASSTRSFGGRSLSGRQNQTISLTIPSPVPPQQAMIVTGLSDDTNTVVTSGLQPGQWVVTKTITGSSGASTSSTAPSILSSLGGGARGLGGGARPAAAPAAAAGR